jgi:hypothetical protein
MTQAYRTAAALGARATALDAAIVVFVRFLARIALELGDAVRCWRAPTPCRTESIDAEVLRIEAESCEAKRTQSAKPNDSAKLSGRA